MRTAPVRARFRIPVPFSAAGVLRAGERDAADAGAGRLSGRGMRKRARAMLLGSLGLAEHANKRPDQLSGGQRQRVAVARALANDPPVILADEPTGSLDSKSSEQVFQILRELVDKKGKTVVAVTHDLRLAERMDRHIELLDGRVIADEQHHGAVTVGR